MPSGACVEGLVDLTLVKDSASPPPVHAVHCERSTQTDFQDASYDCNVSVQVKEEPKSFSPIKKEEDYYHMESDHFDNGSSGSDDISLISLKKKKGKKSINGSVTEKKSRKRKANNMKEWGELINCLPDAKITVVDREDGGVALDSIKQELIEEKPSQLKEIDLFNCCICFTQCFSRTEALQHYR